MVRKEELQRQLKALHQELNMITDTEDDERDATFVGRCFKTRNNYPYSCPKSTKDYWWLYLKVLRADTGLYCLRFQIDCNGRIDIDPSAYMITSSLDSYTSMKPAEFEKAWRRCVLTVEAMPGTED